MNSSTYAIWLRNSAIDVSDPPDFSHQDRLFNRFIINIESQKHFSFLKMGDGDILAYFLHPIIHTTMTNQYREIFSRTLQPLIQHKISSNDPKLILGIENNTPYFRIEQFDHLKWPKDKILDLFERLKHTDSLQNNCIVFSYIYAKEGLDRLFNSLKDRNVIIVGPEYLNRIQFEAKSLRFTVTPRMNSWESQDEIEKNLEKQIEQTQDPVILYACAVTGKMALTKMFFKYGNITQLDIGANLDPYAGEACRPWHPNFHITKHLQEIESLIVQIRMLPSGHEKIGKVRVLKTIIQDLEQKLN